MHCQRRAIALHLAHLGREGPPLLDEAADRRTQHVARHVGSGNVAARTDETALLVLDLGLDHPSFGRGIQEAKLTLLTLLRTLRLLPLLLTLLLRPRLPWQRRGQARLLS